MKCLFTSVLWRSKIIRLHGFCSVGTTESTFNSQILPVYIILYILLILSNRVLVNLRCLEFLNLKLHKKLCLLPKQINIQHPPFIFQIDFLHQEYLHSTKIITNIDVEVNLGMCKCSWESFGIWTQISCHVCHIISWPNNHLIYLRLT